MKYATEYIFRYKDNEVSICGPSLLTIICRDDIYGVKSRIATELFAEIQLIARKAVLLPHTEDRNKAILQIGTLGPWESPVPRFRDVEIEHNEPINIPSNGIIVPWEDTFSTVFDFNPFADWKNTSSVERWGVLYGLLNELLRTCGPMGAKTRMELLTLLPFDLYHACMLCDDAIPKQSPIQLKTHVAKAMMEMESIFRDTTVNRPVITTTLENIYELAHTMLPTLDPVPSIHEGRPSTTIK